MTYRALHIFSLKNCRVTHNNLLEQLSPFNVQIGVYTSMCTRVVCALHNCIKNNMEQKEKGICIGGENMVKCATVRPLIYSVFISQ